MPTRERVREPVQPDGSFSRRAIDDEGLTPRKRLGDSRDWIESVNGFGYRFREG